MYSGLEEHTQQFPGGAMMILSKSKIASFITHDIERFKASLGQGATQILISPFDYASLGPAAYDLHLGPKYILLKGTPVIKEVGEGPVRIEPSESFTVVSKEFIGLPHNLAGMVSARVSWLERGLSPISSFVHPGFFGHLAETLVNLTDKSLEIDADTTFCQIVFFEIAEARVDERYQGERLGKTVEQVMERLVAAHSNPRFVDQVTLPGQKSFGGFLKYFLLGERYVPSEAEAKRLARSPRWRTFK